MVRYPVPLAADKLWPLGGREPLAPGRQGILWPLVICRTLPPRWSSAGHSPPLVISRIPPVGHLPDVRWNPRPPVAILGELERIPEEVSGWNGSELNSERIHVRFSRNRRWNSGGWHRPGKAESGGFPGCRGPPVFFSGRCAGQQIRPMRAPIKLLHLGGNSGGVPRPVVPYGTLRGVPVPRWRAWPGVPVPRRFQMWRGAGEGPSAIGTVLGRPEIRGLRPPFRASSRGFPRKFSAGMAQN